MGLFDVMPLMLLMQLLLLQCTVVSFPQLHLASGHTGHSR
jgi:hypothetical protein